VSAIVLALPGNDDIAQALADDCECELGQMEISQFPDGETHVRIDSNPEGKDVICVCSLARPDPKIMLLLFVLDTARDLGATSVGLVAPYLAYMRQDKRFHSGDSVTAHYFSRILDSHIDWLVTIDPHLHRIRALSEIYAHPAHALHATGLIAEWIADNIERPFLIGPDSESSQWVKSVAAGMDAPFTVLTKERLGDRKVRVSLPHPTSLKGHAPVIVDDIISTAQTMIETTKHLLQAGLPAPVCIGVHAIFAGDAVAQLMAAGAARIVTCNTIPHETNEIDVSPLLIDHINSKVLV